MTKRHRRSGGSAGAMRSNAITAKQSCWRGRPQPDQFTAPQAAGTALRKAVGSAIPSGLCFGWLRGPAFPLRPEEPLAAVAESLRVPAYEKLVVSDCRAGSGSGGGVKGGGMSSPGSGLQPSNHPFIRCVQSYLQFAHGLRRGVVAWLPRSLEGRDGGIDWAVDQDGADIDIIQVLRQSQGSPNPAYRPGGVDRLHQECNAFAGAMRVALGRRVRAGYFRLLPGFLSSRRNRNDGISMLMA